MFLDLDLRGLNCPLPEPRTRKMLCLLAQGDCQQNSETPAFAPHALRGAFWPKSPTAFRADGGRGKIRISIVVMSL